MLKAPALSPFCLHMFCRQPVCPVDLMFNVLRISGERSTGRTRTAEISNASSRASARSRSRTARPASPAALRWVEGAAVLHAVLSRSSTSVVLSALGREHPFGFQSQLSQLAKHFHLGQMQMHQDVIKYRADNLKRFDKDGLRWEEILRILTAQNMNSSLSWQMS